MNYYLDYRTSETNGEVRTILQVVNYRLVYGMCKSKYGFKAKNCPLGRPVWGIFFGDFTEEEWFLIEKGSLEYFQQPLYRAF